MPRFAFPEIRAGTVAATVSPNEAMIFAAECEADSGIYGSIVASIIAGETIGTFDPYIKGDNELSGGWLMVYTGPGVDPAERLPLSQWLGPDGARRAWARICRNRWVNAMRGYPDAAERWRSDPAGFLTSYWPAAQGCDADLARQAAPEAVKLGVGAWNAYRQAPPPPEIGGLWWDNDNGWWLPAKGEITALFGPTTEQLDGPADYRGKHYEHFNRGIDIGCAEGTPVLATRGGAVVWADWRNREGQRVDDGHGWGLTVWVRDADGILHNYGHNSRLLVREGDTVARGHQLSLSGNTGASTGPHCSYDVMTARLEPLDPTPYLVGPRPTAVMTATATEALSVRDQPRADSDRLYTMSKGELVGLTVAVTCPIGAWLPCGYGERTAYVYGGWLAGHPDVPPAPPPAPPAPGPDDLAAAIRRYLRDTGLGITEVAGVLDEQRRRLVAVGEDLVRKGAG